jgi:predicted Zn-dependent protease
MNRENASFLMGGIFFGFLVGFSVAYFTYHAQPGEAARGSSMQAPVNASDPMGGAGQGAGGAMPAGGGQGGAASADTMQQVQQEIGALRHAIEQNPNDAKALGRLGDLFYDAGMFDKASEYYVRSLQNDPKNPNISTDLGICYQRLGRIDEALAQFRASLQNDPRHWQSWLNLGIVSLFDKKDVKTAEQAFAKVQELNPTYQGIPQLQQELQKMKSGRP